MGFNRTAVDMYYIRPLHPVCDVCVGAAGDAHARISDCGSHLDSRGGRVIRGDAQEQNRRAVSRAQNGCPAFCG